MIPHSSYVCSSSSIASSYTAHHLALSPYGPAPPYPNFASTASRAAAAATSYL